MVTLGNYRGQRPSGQQVEIFYLSLPLFSSVIDGTIVLIILKFILAKNIIKQKGIRQT